MGYVVVAVGLRAFCSLQGRGLSWPVLGSGRRHVAALARGRDPQRSASRCASGHPWLARGKPGARGSNSLRSVKPSSGARRLSGSCVVVMCMSSDGSRVSSTCMVSKTHAVNAKSGTSLRGHDVGLRRHRRQPLSDYRDRRPGPRVRRSADELDPRGATVAPQAPAQHHVDAAGAGRSPPQHDRHQHSTTATPLAPPRHCRHRPNVIPACPRAQDNHGQHHTRSNGALEDRKQTGTMRRLAGSCLLGPSLPTRETCSPECPDLGISKVGVDLDSPTAPLLTPTLGGTDLKPKAGGRDSRLKGSAESHDQEGGGHAPIPGTGGQDTVRVPVHSSTAPFPGTGDQDEAVRLDHVVH